MKSPARLVNEVVMTPDVHSYSTRATHQGDVHMPKSNIELYRQSYTCLMERNDLPQDIKNAPNIEEFKNRFKK